MKRRRALQQVKRRERFIGSAASTEERGEREKRASFKQTSSFTSVFSWFKDVDLVLYTCRLVTSSSTINLLYDTH